MFGFNGTTIMLGRFAIRHILFFLSFISLYGFFGYLLIRNKIKLISKKSFRSSYIGSFKLIDIAVTVFLAGALIWTFVIPLIMGTELYEARREMLDSIRILSLYYPLSWFNRTKILSIHTLDKLLYVLTILFATAQTIFYFGLELDIDFIAKVFGVMEKLSFGTGIFPEIILGHLGTPRVIFSTSIFLLLGIYLLLRHKHKNRLIFCYAVFVNTTALLATLTKSFWLGVLIGLLIPFIYTVTVSLKAKDYKRLTILLLCVCLIFGYCVAAHYIIFDNTISLRLFTAFSTDRKDNITLDNNMEDIFLDAAAESNNDRLEQTIALLEKWEKSPLIGYGYGSYTEDCIRSEERIFSYEMLLPSLIMKLGIIGFAVWIFFIAALIISMVRATKNRRDILCAWLYFTAALALSVQTNPLLLSYVGMSLLLYALLVCVGEQPRPAPPSDTELDFALSESNHESSHSF